MDCIVDEEDPLKNEIEELADSILAVKAEQEYIVARERRHRDSRCGCHGVKCVINMYDV